MKTLLFTAPKFIILLLFSNVLFLPCRSQIIQKVKDVRFANSFPFDFTVSNNKLFFIAADNTNSGVFVTDGTEAGTVKLTSSIGFPSISDIVAYNNKIYFTNTDGINGYELWVSDGTVAGTSIFKDINPGSAGSYPKNFTVANNKLFFITDIDQKLYVCDGTPAGTTILKNNGAIIFNGLAQFAILNNDIYFTSDNGTGSGYGMWKSDGTLAGTLLLMPNIVSTIPGDYAVLNNTLFFSTDDGVHGTELWTTNGTAGGTSLVINLRADGGGIFSSGAPYNMINFKNKIYFTASDDIHGAELFSSDGSAAGTQIVMDIIPGIQGSLPLKSVIYNGNLYFSCSNGATTAGLWKSDGTPAGTTLVKQGGGNDPFLNDAKFAPPFNGILYFVANDNHFYPLWQTDGTSAGTKIATFQNTTAPAQSQSNDFKFSLFNSELYFSGQCGTISLSFQPCKLTNGALPVTWLDIQAQWISEREAKVSWQVAQQQNVENYTVQYSSDGLNFTNVFSMASSSVTSYNCTIPTDFHSKNYYRVMQKDMDGKISFSKIVLLNNTSNPLISIYPNPAKDKLYLKSITKHSSGTITDVTGKILLHALINDAEKMIDISKLSKGIYFLKLTSVANFPVLMFIKD
jgi:ELWxxDGT repeat protein